MTRLTRINKWMTFLIWIIAFSAALYVFYQTKSSQSLGRPVSGFDWGVVGTVFISLLADMFFGVKGLVRYRKVLWIGVILCLIWLAFSLKSWFLVALFIIGLPYKYLLKILKGESQNGALEKSRDTKA